uniref:DUF4590 domain-containing protein n=1 Tax=Magallana gigas TaxID=29159 RepID=K1QC77_MAGGI
MSHVYEGPLATYNSLTDRNLSGYFSNTRMRRHLRKAGLVNKRGELLSENQYRLNMARKEHKKHVKDMLAQAIVHKSLDMERTRQVEIRRKLEEIAKIELVRRVRNDKHSNDSYLLPLLSPRTKWVPPPTPTPPPPPPEEEEEEEKSSRGRKGDEEILPYLSPRSSRSASRPETANQQRYRPQSAPSGNHYENVVYVDEHGRELSPNGREDFRTTKAKPQEIDTKHLYALDSAALRKYALQLSRIEQESMSPYLHSPLPTPPRSHRGNRVGSRPRIRSRPRTAEPHRSLSPREKKGTLMLHRQEPAMLHQGEVQTLCEITMKYHGPNLTLPRDQYDPTQNISIDQQHCGGNTLTVFKENLKPGDTFSFISRRHRGFPFSLSIFMDGRVDCRVSTCCEYKHAKGVKLGGKMGHFSLLKVEGATPCYKCKLTSKASPRSLKRPPKTQKQPEQLKEEVIVVDRRHVQELSSEVNEEEDENVEIPVEDDSTQQKNKCDTFIDPNPTEDREKDVSKSKNKESPKVKEEVKDDVISPEEADEKYDDDFDDDEDEEEEKKDEEKEIHGETIEGLENPCSFEKKSGDKKENEEGEINGKEQNLKTTNKQVRFNAEVQKMGTPESSLSRPEIVNDEDDKAEIEDVKPEDVEDGNPNALVNNEDEGAMDTCDEVSEIETDLESPRKIKENDNMKVEKESESQGDSKKKRNEKDDAKNKVKEHDNKPQDNQSDDNYSDDFEGSSESTVISLKDQGEKPKTQDHENSVPNASRCGEYYDEAYACNGDKLSQHDENACVSVNENAQPNPETISMKSFDEEKKFYVEEDSENEELKQGPLKTTYEDMNIIGPLATLLMKVRRKKREMQSRMSVDSESDQDGQKETSEGFGSSSSLEKESGRLGSQTSLSSLPFENQPNGKKKLQPIVLEKKKRKKKVSSASSLTDSEKPESVSSHSSRSSSRSSSPSHSESDEEEGDRNAVSHFVYEDKKKKKIVGLAADEDTRTEKTETDKESVSEIRKVSGYSDEEEYPDGEKYSKEQNASTKEPEEKEETDKVLIGKSRQLDSQPRPTPIVRKESVPVEFNYTSYTESVTSGDVGKSITEEESFRPRSPLPKEFQYKKQYEDSPPRQDTLKSFRKSSTSSNSSSDGDESSGSEDSSSDSGSSSSDSESENEEEKKKSKEKLEEKDKKSDSNAKSVKEQKDLPISESDTDKKVSIFNSDTDGENMHGGNDPDEVEAGGKGATSYLSRIGVKPGIPVEGSVTPMFEGKSDIDLNSIALSNEQVTEISDYLAKKDDIKTFSLRNACLDSDKFENILKALKTTKSEIQMINMNLNKLNATSAKEIGELLVEKPSLQILLLHGNPVGDTGIKYISESLKDIHSAYLSHKDEENPPKYCQLLELDLGDTAIGDEGVEHVSTLLESNTSLKTLNLNGNTKITVAGWKRLGKALKKNTTLHTLTLDFNKIGDDGIAGLVSGLKDNQTLKVLELEEGSISDEGGRKLVELLKCNTTILDITVSPGNAISEKIRGEIVNYLGLNKAAAQPKSS